MIINNQNIGDYSIEGLKVIQKTIKLEIKNRQKTTKIEIIEKGTFREMLEKNIDEEAKEEIEMEGMNIMQRLEYKIEKFNEYRKRIKKPIRNPWSWLRELQKIGNNDPETMIALMQKTRNKGWIGIFSDNSFTSSSSKKGTAQA